jgi:hypothetical protein
MLMTEGSVMTTREKEQAPPSERDRVRGWRAQLLVEAGMTYDDAWRLSRRENWRDALDPIKRGCPPDLAFEIVR